MRSPKSYVRPYDNVSRRCSTIFCVLAAVGGTRVISWDYRRVFGIYCARSPAAPASVPIRVTISSATADSGNPLTLQATAELMHPHAALLIWQHRAIRSSLSGIAAGRGLERACFYLGSSVSPLAGDVDMPSINAVHG